MIGNSVKGTLFTVLLVVAGLYCGNKLTIDYIRQNNALVCPQVEGNVGDSSDLGVKERSYISTAVDADKRLDRPQVNVEQSYLDVDEGSETSSAVDGKVLPETLANVDQSTNELADHIRERWIRPPFTGDRKLKNPNQTHYSQGGQSEFVDKLLNGRRNGFYIECGAANGEAFSNSLFFEKSRGWSGLLIEANPVEFESVLLKRRHAYMLNACLSPTKKPKILEFRTADLIGGLVNFMDDGHKDRVSVKRPDSESLQIQCFPLFSVLRALQITHVDYFSLDIEGAELEVLETIPFDELTIDVLSVEYFISGNPEATQTKLKQLKELMVDRFGYKVADYPSIVDVIFVKNL